MTAHYLIVTRDDLSPDEQAEYDAGDAMLRRDIDRDRTNTDVECSGMTPACEGWIECMADHPDDLGEETDEAHGVEHMRFSFGWGIRTGACSLYGFPDSWCDSAGELAAVLGPGRHRIDFDWDDEYIDLRAAATDAIPP